MTVSPTARFPATRLREPRDAAEVYGVCLCVLFDSQLQSLHSRFLSLTRAVPWRLRGLVSPGIPAICGPGDTSYRWFRLHRWLSSGQPVYATNPIGGYCACYSLDVVAAVRAAIATGSRQRFPVPRSSCAGTKALCIMCAIPKASQRRTPQAHRLSARPTTSPRHQHLLSQRWWPPWLLAPATTRRPRPAGGFGS